MAQSMSPSAKTITDGQIVKLTDQIIAKLRKSGLPSDASQQVIEAQCEDIARKLVRDFSTRVHIHANASLPPNLRREIFYLDTVFGSHVKIDGLCINECFGGNPGARIFFSNEHKYGPSMDEEKYLLRLMAKPAGARLNFKDFLMLYEEKGQLTLRWMYEKRDVTWISFDDISMYQTNGFQISLRLTREEDGSWSWHAHLED